MFRFVYVIAQERVKFGINFMSCSENGKFAVIATTSGIYPKILLLPVLSQINTIVSFVKVKISCFHTRFHNELWFLLLLLPSHNGSGLSFFFCS